MADTLNRTNVAIGGLSLLAALGFGVYNVVVPSAGRQQPTEQTISTAGEGSPVIVNNEGQIEINN